jgi:hypothetical protein
MKNTTNEISVLVDKEQGLMRNCNINYKCEIIKRKGWKTFKGMVYQLKLYNKQCKKLNIVADYTVRLPLK